MTPESWLGIKRVAAWGIAGLWCVKTTDFLQNFSSIADLTDIDWNVRPERMPSLCVIVPACNEAANIAATLDTLLQQDYRNLRVLAVDDRSNDATGAIMDEYAARFPGRMDVLHITELPDGWLGKTHALELAVTVSAGWDGGSEYVLFTDADILFSPSILRRSLAYAEQEHADHLVTLPTMQVKSWGEGVVLGFFQVMPVWASRLWRVSNPQATRDAIGIGAFNMLRRDALATMGGLAPQRLVVLEDIILGRRVKAAGLRQRVAFAPGLVLVHWAAGMRGVIGVMSKNLYSASNFNPFLASGIFAWVGLCFLAPLAGLFGRWTWPAALLVSACIGVIYKTYGEKSLTPPKYFWTYPLGAVLFCYAMLRSIVKVTLDGGVRWRGTLYPLRELRKHNSPFAWSKPKVRH